MRRIMAIVGGVVAATLAMYVPVRAESPRAISIQGRAVVLPPVAREYDRLAATLPTVPTVHPVAPPTLAGATVGRPAVMPPPGPPDGTPLMQRVEYFKSDAYRRWFEEQVKATAREHLSGASRGK